MFKFFRKYQQLMLVFFVCVLMVAFLIQGSLSIFQTTPETRVVGTMGGQKVLARDLARSEHDLAILPRLTNMTLPEDTLVKAERLGLSDHISGILLEIDPASADPFPWISHFGQPETPAQRNRAREQHDPTRWMMILDDARRLGIAVSDDQVNKMLDSLGIRNDEDMQKLLQALSRVIPGIQPGDIRIALGDWAIVQEYGDLVSGYASVSPAEKLHEYLLAARSLVDAVFQTAVSQIALQQGKVQQFIDARNQSDKSLNLAEYMVDGVRNQLRLSEPLLAHFLDDREATVSIELLPISYRTRLSDVSGDQLAQTMAELYQKYANTLPGQGKPYPFGYRYPDRVKIEYLAFPIDRVKAAIKIEGLDALKFYDQHRDHYRELYAREHSPAATQPAAGAAATTQTATTNPTTQASDTQVFEALLPTVLEDAKDQLAPVECARMVKEAQELLMEAERRLGERDGYRVVPPEAEWDSSTVATPNSQPAGATAGGRGSAPAGGAVHAVSMARVQELLAHDPHFNFVRPDFTPCGQWISADHLNDLEGIGSAVLLEGRNSPAALHDYVLSAKEFGPSMENRLVKDRLQRGVVSQALTGRDGSMYLFRLCAVDPAHAPASPDEVRPALERDARALLAYQLLQRPNQIAALSDRLDHASKLEDLLPLADATDRTLGVRHPDPFARLVRTPGGFEVPDISGAGQPGFVSAVFHLAQVAYQAAYTPTGPITIDTLPMSLRSAVIPADQTLSVCLVRLLNYKPMLQSQLEANAAAPILPDAINAQLLPDAQRDDPLSLEALKQRVGYVEQGQGARAED